jgi:hypothetical protein
MKATLFPLRLNELLGGVHRMLNLRGDNQGLVSIGNSKGLEVTQLKENVVEKGHESAQML